MPDRHTPIMLDSQERTRFAEWLLREAATNEGLVEQMKLIRASQMVVEHIEKRAAAARLIAKGLLETEDA